MPFRSRAHNLGKEENIPAVSAASQWIAPPSQEEPTMINTCSEDHDPAVSSVSAVSQRVEDPPRQGLIPPPAVGWIWNEKSRFWRPPVRSKGAYLSLEKNIPVVIVAPRDESPCQGDKANTDLQVGGFGDAGSCQGDAVDAGIPTAPTCWSSGSMHPVLPPHTHLSGNPWPSRVPAATVEEDRSHHSVRVLSDRAQHRSCRRVPYR